MDLVVEGEDLNLGSHCRSHLFSPSVYLYILPYVLGRSFSAGATYSPGSQVNNSNLHSCWGIAILLF